MTHNRNFTGFGTAHCIGTSAKIQEYSNQYNYLE